MGGLQNFAKQHRPGVSKACHLNLKRKNEAAAHKESQPGLLSFFTKQPKHLIPSTIPIPAPVIAYAMESQSSRTYVTAPITAPLLPNTPASAVNILTTLEKAVEHLPVLPNASDANEIAVFSANIPTNLATEEAWEYLDPILNCFLGFRRMAESIYDKLHGGERGLPAMVQYLKEFVGQYQIDGALLEGKIERLVNVIQTQCIAMTRSKYTHL